MSTVKGFTQNTLNILMKWKAGLKTLQTKHEGGYCSLVGNPTTGTPDRTWNILEHFGSDASDISLDQIIIFVQLTTGYIHNGNRK